MDMLRSSFRAQVNRVAVLAGLVVAISLSSACTTDGGLGLPAHREAGTPSTSAESSPRASAQEGPAPQSAWAADARACQTTSPFAAAGSRVAGRAGSALLVSGTAGPEPGDVPVKERMEQLGYLVTVRDDDDVSASDAAGMQVVLISESVSSSAIDSTFTSLTVPIVVWERQLFETLKMSVGNNWHTDPQETIYVSDASLLCGVAGEVEVATSDAHPMNRALPPASATVSARRSAGSDEAVWFGYGTGDLLVDGTPAPAPRVALWFSYETPLHTNELGWQLFARAIQLAAGASTDPSVAGDRDGALDPDLDAGGPASADTSAPPSTSPTTTTRSGPPVPTTEPTTTPPTTQPTTQPTTPPVTTAPASTPPPTDPPTTTEPPTQPPTTTEPPTQPPTTTEPPATTEPPTTTEASATTEPREQPPGDGPPPWASGPPREPEPDDDDDLDDEEDDDDEPDDEEDDG